MDGERALDLDAGPVGAEVHDQRVLAVDQGAAGGAAAARVAEQEVGGAQGHAALLLDVELAELAAVVEVAGDADVAGREDGEGGGAAGGDEGEGVVLTQADVPPGLARQALAVADRGPLLAGDPADVRVVDHDPAGAAGPDRDVLVAVVPRVAGGDHEPVPAADPGDADVERALGGGGADAEGAVDGERALDLGAGPVGGEVQDQRVLVVDQGAAGGAAAARVAEQEVGGADRGGAVLADVEPGEQAVDLEVALDAQGRRAEAGLDVEDLVVGGDEAQAVVEVVVEPLGEVDVGGAARVGGDQLDAGVEGEDLEAVISGALDPQVAAGDGEAVARVVGADADVAGAAVDEEAGLAGAVADAEALPHAGGVAGVLGRGEADLPVGVGGRIGAVEPERAALLAGARDHAEGLARELEHAILGLVELGVDEVAEVAFGRDRVLDEVGLELLAVLCGDRHDTPRGLNRW